MAVNRNLSRGPDFSLENDLLKGTGDLFDQAGCCIIGVDEAGRGPWAGPVTAGAAWINPEALNMLPAGINDSKKLSASRRAELWEALQHLAGDPSCLQVAVASIEASAIDRDGLLPATFEAMENAALALTSGMEASALHLLVDGNLRQPFRNLAKVRPVQATPVVKGDKRSLSIAIAAIAAKQTRDGIMDRLDDQFPGYGWKDNKGYGTRQHADALAKQGPSPCHRLSFRPVAAVAAAHDHTR